MSETPPLERMARGYPDKLDVARTHWLVTTPNGKTVELMMYPPVNEREMKAIYPGCKLEVLE